MLSLSQLWILQTTNLLGTQRHWVVAGQSLFCILFYTLLVGAGASETLENGDAVESFPSDWIRLTTDGERMWMEVDRK